MSLSTLKCEQCDFIFSRKDALVRHIKEQRCEGLKKASQSEPRVIRPRLTLKEKSLILHASELEKQLVEKDQKIAQLENNSTPLSAEALERLTRIEKDMAELKENPPSVNNQVLQVVCISDRDNYLDMLTIRFGSFQKALEYIRGCALGSIMGDIQLLENIYFGGHDSFHQPSIRYADKKKTKIEYYNEKKEKVCESKENFAKIIANNVQNSYLKGINHVTKSHLDSNGCPNKFLAEYDIQTWNQHIFELSDFRYHIKLLNHLNIPF